ncbi:MAG: trigger factor [Zoogloeaceae bacterium]|jgi:trigger factor|nr:trigger factor [Zoogloeaceae bacterium]
MESQLPESASLSDDQKNQETPENPLLRRYTLDLSVQELTKAREAYLRRLARTVSMPGFRPGKVPFRRIEQEYGEEAHEETLLDLLNKEWKEHSSQFDVASVLGMDETPSPDPEKRRFVVSFEVFPEFELADLSQLSIVRPYAQVTDDDVDQYLDDLRMEQGKDVEVERGAQLDDFVTLSYSMTLDGAPLPDEDAEDIEVVVGETDAWEAFDEEIIGLKAGESKTFDFVYPERNATESLAGKTVRVCATISKVEVWTKADLDADFARKNGIEDGDLDALRASIRKDLEKKSAQFAWRQTKENVMDALLEAHTFVLPESLVEEKTRQRMDEAKEEMEQFLHRIGGRKTTLPEEIFSLSPESYVAEVQRQMSLSLILKKIGTLGNIPSSPRSEFEALKQEEQLIGWVLARVKVEDMPCSYETLEDWRQKSRYS